MGNFVNVPYSLAMRHQLYQCYLNLNTDSLPGWTHNLEVGPGQIVCVCVHNTECVWCSVPVNTLALAKPNKLLLLVYMTCMPLHHKVLQSFCV